MRKIGTWNLNWNNILINKIDIGMKRIVRFSEISSLYDSFIFDMDGVIVRN